MIGMNTRYLADYTYIALSKKFHMCVFVCLFMCVCLFVCVCVRACVYMCVYVCQCHINHKSLTVHLAKVYLIWYRVSLRAACFGRPASHGEKGTNFP